MNVLDVNKVISLITKPLIPDLLVSLFKIAKYKMILLGVVNAAQAMSLRKEDVYQVYLIACLSSPHYNVQNARKAIKLTVIVNALEFLLTAF